jgi:GH24 family phage-related lysozyme (muramidase)
MWRQFSDPLEGVCLFPYLDIKRLCTTATGVLIKTIEHTLKLPWTIDGRSATEAEVRADFDALHANPDAHRWVASKQAKLTRIRLTEETADKLVTQRLNANVEYMRTKLFPGVWDDLGADSQLGLCSLAWAIGAGFNQTRPALVAAVNRRDWLAVKSHAHIKETNNVGVVPRNRQQELLFDNALTVQERDLDPSWLWWPNRCPQDSTLREEAIKALGMIK